MDESHIERGWGNLDIRSIVFILVRCWASYIAYLVSGNSLSGAKVFGDAFSGIPTMGVFWKIGFGERKFSADWFSGREKFSGYEKPWWCFVVRGVSEGNLFWFLELRGFETVSNGFLPCAMFACQVNFCGLMICCMHIHNLVTSCVVHCSPQWWEESLRRRSANGEKTGSEGGAMHCSCLWLVFRC